MDGARTTGHAGVAESILVRAGGFLYRCRNDAAYTMTYMEGAVRPLTGLPAEAFLAVPPQSYAALIDDEDRGQVYDAVDRALAARVNWTVSYRLRHPGGQSQWVQECGGGVFDAQDRLLFLEGFVIDCAASKSAEAAATARHTAVVARCQSLMGETAPVMGVLRLLKILSLNARIEAARSGAVGAGFAVVADEIGKIAEQTGIRAERIAQITTELQALMTSA